MNSAHDFVGELDSDVPISRPPLASWYTPAASDGLGDRLVMFDNTGAVSLELLRFRPQFSDATFERALRDRVERLRSFQHPAFPRVLSVERLDGEEGLTLVSTHAPGKRLSDVFRDARPRSGMRRRAVGVASRSLRR